VECYQAPSKLVVFFLFGAGKKHQVFIIGGLHVNSRFFDEGSCLGFRLGIKEYVEG
jgi:hypothetical protein